MSVEYIERKLKLIAAEKPIAPFVHMNGTSRKDLQKDLMEAIENLQDALHFLQKTAPNGRDYYNHPAGSGSFNTASAEHKTRLAKVDSVIAELTSIYEQIDV